MAGGTGLGFRVLSFEYRGVPGGVYVLVGGSAVLIDVFFGVGCVDVDARFQQPSLDQLHLNGRHSGESPTTRPPRFRMQREQ